MNDSTVIIALWSADAFWLGFWLAIGAAAGMGVAGLAAHLVEAALFRSRRHATPRQFGAIPEDRP